MAGPVFDAILGHEVIINRIGHSLANGRPGHAWLFHGPQGVGKRTTALALIQSLFCPQPVRLPNGGVSGCGDCSSCRKCLTGNHPDLQWLELQEKKVRISVEQVRELAHFIAFSPLESPWKAAIVDDAAQMNAAAANALLKTLEEPPPGSMLILITHHPGGLLPTIGSRCQKERFFPLSEEQILTILERLKVGKTLEERQEAARLAVGSVGHAVQLCVKGAIENRRRFFRDLDALPDGGLAQVVALAEEWGKAELFSMVPQLLETWFRERIRVSVLSGEAHRLDTERWLEAALRTGQLARDAQVVNLNPRLTLETIFIRLARMQGAAF
ncbi:MAG: DNA polymerase III subunit delta' [Magnetococcales bacterium]|nr:DNA polymerase III subunit delta' [Magnetococcales bacterium]